ncbi:MAG TPA: hypothetical protein DCQ53_10665 [Alphaproteobacteria bacterium]|nr:hypothetical protein [Alphaproteobacteria bacterium]
MRPAGGLSSVKRAATVWFELIATTQVDVADPVHGPSVHPAKLDSGAAEAVSVTLLDTSNSPLQVGPQSMPAGALVTVPEPAPGRETVRVRFGLCEIEKAGAAEFALPAASLATPPAIAIVTEDPVPGVIVAV